MAQLVPNELGHISFPRKLGYFEAVGVVAGTCGNRVSLADTRSG